MRQIWTAVAAFALLVSVPHAACADPRLDKTGAMDSGGVHLDFDDYYDGKGQVVALIGMKGNGDTISFAFDKNDWPNLLRLWRKARAMTGEKYATAGSLTEVGSSAKCVISFAGGPDVRITLVDPTTAVYVFTVSPDQEADFEAKLIVAGEAATVVN